MGSSHSSRQTVFGSQPLSGGRQTSSAIPTPQQLEQCRARALQFDTQ